MSPTEEALAILDSLREPVFLLEVSGQIAAGNRAGRALLGNSAIGKEFSAYLGASSTGFGEYLRRCTGTTEPLPAAVKVKRLDGSEVGLKAYGARVRTAAERGPTRVLLRLVSAEGDGFSVLARQVRALNREVHQRRRTQVALEEALARNETLFRELQHRVKNNVQMLLGLFGAAKRETRHGEVRAFLEEVAARLRAVVAAQQLMYQARDLDSVPAQVFISSLCEEIGRSHGSAARLLATAFDGELRNDVVLPLALILSELLTNAYKHGAAGDDARIVVDLAQDGSGCVLTVRDNGPGLPADATERRSSGLGLVRGLCRQIRGSLAIDNLDGTRCVVRFAGRDS